MRCIALALLLPVAAFAQAPPDPLHTTEAQSEIRVHRALSVRHPVPSCAEVEALTPTPVDTLLKLVDEAAYPPWVPMRAAECLARRHHGQISPRLQRWVTDPELKGLGILVVNLLDELPADLGQELALRALREGPDPAGVRTRLRRSAQPALRALAETDVVTP